MTETPEKLVLDAEAINRLFPVVGIEQYKNGVVKVIRKSEIPHVSRETIRGDRSDITEFSARARAALAFVVAATSVEFRSILTLTYGNFWPHDMQVSKVHLNAFLTTLRMRYGRPLNYVWIVEFQRRGAPHYHVLLSTERPPDEFVNHLAWKWADIVTPKMDLGKDELVDDDIMDDFYKVHRVHSHPKAWENIRSVDGATRYITKYCLKPEQKEVPPHITNVGRFYGMSREVKQSIEAVASLELTGDELSLALRAFDHKVGNWQVTPKYIFGVELLAE